jgi:DHA1 family inner membrane transport protein
VLALAASAFAYVTTENLPIGLLPELADALDRSTSAVGMLVTAYGLVVVAATIPLTRLTRGIDRRTLLVVLLGIFTTFTLVSAAAPGYPALLAARIATAFSQALFWALVVPTAAGLAPAHRRGRTLSLIFAGGSVAVVMGVPAGTWIGQVAGWRLPFLVLAGIGLAAMVALLVLLPHGAGSAMRVGTPPPAEPEPATHPVPATGSPARPERPASPPNRPEPSPRAYRRLVAVTVLASTGAFVAYTYITAFLDEVTRLSPSAAGPALLVRGLAGLAGVAIGGYVTDRRPRQAVPCFVLLQALALGGLAFLGQNPVASVGLWAITGLAFAGFGNAAAGRLLAVAPGDPDLASAGISTAVNVGITAGAFGGGMLLSAFGATSTVLAGAVLSAAALVPGRASR